MEREIGDAQFKVSKKKNGKINKNINNDSITYIKLYIKTNYRFDVEIEYIV